MKNVDIEDMVIADLKKNATTLLKVLDRDTQSALRAKDPDVMTAINVNLRTLTAINEVLMYYGDAGVFNEEGSL